MGFFNPFLLWALPLAAVPIVIHLLNRRRHQKTPWAAMEFLLRALKRNRRRMLMEHWIILILRTLAVIFLVFLVTRPQLEGGRGLLQARTHHIVCLDDSASMSQRRGTGNLFSSGLEQVRDIVAELSESNDGDVFTLMLSSERDSQPLVAAARINSDLEQKIQEALAGRLVGDTSLEPGEFLSAALAWAVEMEPEAQDIHYYLVTDSRVHDFIREGKPHPGVLAHLQGLNPVHHRITLQLVGGGDVANVGVTAVRRRDRLATAGVPVGLTVEITNFGDETSGTGEVAIEIDGQSRVVRPFEPIAPGERALVDLVHTFREAGFHGIVATLASDRYPTDDGRALALEVVDVSEILVVNGDQGTSEQESETFYLNAALEFGGDVLSGIAVTEILPHNLADEDLSEVNMVWLANVPTPLPEVVDKLEEFVADGGGLVVFLGDQVDPARYNAALYRDGEGLLPIRLGELKGDVDRPDHVFVADPTHFAIQDNAGFLDFLLSNMVLVHRYFEMIEEDDSPRSVALRVKGATGSPLLVSKTIGRGGYSILFGSSADDHWTDFCITPAYLVVCQELHKYATRQHSLASYNLSTRDSLRLDFDPADYRRDVLISGLGVDGLERTFTALEGVPGSDGEVTATLTVPMRELMGLGLFQVVMTPQRGDVERRLLARSGPVDEGRMQRLSRAQWLGSFPGFEDRLEILEQEETQAGGREAGRGELWRLLAFGLLGLLLLETILAWRFGRR